MSKFHARLAAPALVLSLLPAFPQPPNRLRLGKIATTIRPSSEGKFEIQSGEAIAGGASRRVGVALSARARRLRSASR